MSPNKSFNKQYSSCACVLEIFAHFFAMLCKITRDYQVQEFTKLYTEHGQ